LSDVGVKDPKPALHVFGFATSFFGGGDFTCGCVVAFEGGDLAAETATNEDSNATSANASARRAAIFANIYNLHP